MKYILVTILLTLLTACGQQTAIPPTETSIPTVVSSTPVPTSTFIPVIYTPSPTPPGPIFPVITPDPIQVERWIEYEVALANVLLPPNSLRGEVLCEWELLGRSEREIYVWAVCQSPPYTAELPPSIVSIPAIVHLGENGSVQSVEIPGSGSHYTRDIDRMFSTEVQEKFDQYHFGRAKTMSEYINWRREHPGEPPMLIFSITLTP